MSITASLSRSHNTQDYSIRNRKHMLYFPNLIFDRSPAGKIPNHFIPSGSLKEHRSLSRFSNTQMWLMLYSTDSRQPHLHPPVMHHLRHPLPNVPRFLMVPMILSHSRLQGPSRRSQMLTQKPYLNQIFVTFPPNHSDRLPARNFMSCGNCGTKSQRT
jgi:hypothetical protein